MPNPIQFNHQLPTDSDLWSLVSHFDLSAPWFQLLQDQTIFAQVKPLYAYAEGSALLPLQQESPRQLAGLFNFYSSFYAPLLATGCGVQQLADLLQVLKQNYPCDVLRFDAMDPAAPSFEVLEQALRLAGFQPCRFFCFNNWYLPVHGRSYQDYFNGLSSRVKNTVKRRSKAFFAEGKGRVELITRAEGIQQYSDIWTAIYNRSWKVPEPYPLFMPRLIEMCAQQGWLRLGIAWYEDQPVAAQLWIVSHHKAAIYKLAYDEQFAPLSAGTVLTAQLMQHALDVDQVSEVDYLVGDDAYKRDWMSHCRQRWGIVAYNRRSVRGLAGYGLQCLGQWRRRFLKKHEHPDTSTGSTTSSTTS